MPKPPVVSRTALVVRMLIFMAVLVLAVVLLVEGYGGLAAVASFVAAVAAAASTAATRLTGNSFNKPKNKKVPKKASTPKAAVLSTGDRERPRLEPDGGSDGDNSGAGATGDKAAESDAAA